MMYKIKIFNQECFKCNICGIPLTPDNAEIRKNVPSLKDLPYCEKHINSPLPICDICSELIETFNEKKQINTNNYHIECLYCVKCKNIYKSIFYFI